MERPPKAATIVNLGVGIQQAILSVMVLAAAPPHSVVPASALGAFLGVSPSYLLKQLQALSGARILAGVPGPRGGYWLAVPAANVSLLDIISAIDGATSSSHQRQSPAGKTDGKCCTWRSGRIESLIRSADLILQAELRNVSVKDLLDDALSSSEDGPRVTAFVKHNARPSSRPGYISA